MSNLEELGKHLDLQIAVVETDNSQEGYKRGVQEGLRMAKWLTERYIKEEQDALQEKKRKKATLGTILFGTRWRERV